MAYTLKTSGIALNLIVCVLVDDDGTSIVDLKGNAITLGTGCSASATTGSWKSTARNYFQTLTNGTFDFDGVSWNSTYPTVDETATNGMSVWFACAGASNNSANAACFVGIGSDATHGLKRVSTSDAHGYFDPAGGTQAVSATALPTDGTTAFSFGANYKSASDSEVFYGLESGSLASDGTAGSDGGFGGVRDILTIGGMAGQGNQPFNPYIVCVFDTQLTLSEMQSLHNDWFGTLIDGGAGPTGETIAWITA